MKFVVVGGTGTLGRALIHLLLQDNDVDEVVCLSRDELKQSQMKEELRRHGARLSFALGDVREPDSLYTHFQEARAVFHVAALKQIDTLEDNPEEAIRTNLLGTINVMEMAIAQNVDYVAFSSTDKAVYPINAYGMTKALAEKVLLRNNSIQKRSTLTVFRWGNIVGSRGSFIPRMIELIDRGQTVPITDRAMTRFWMTLDRAAQFFMENYMMGGLVIPEIYSAALIDVAETIAKLLGKTLYISYTGIRAGEKIHECLEREGEDDETDQDAYSNSSHRIMTDVDLTEFLRPYVRAYQEKK